MKLALAVAAVLAIGCGDNEAGGPRTLLDYVEVFSEAAEAHAISCDKARGDQVAEMIIERICAGADCSAPPRCNVHLDECVTELLDMPCDADTFPSACLDMYPNFACMYGEADHGRS